MDHIRDRQTDRQTDRERERQKEREGGGRKREKVRGIRMCYERREEGGSTAWERIQDSGVTHKKVLETILHYQILACNKPGV